MDLNEAARAYPEIVRKHLGSLIGPDFGKFEALANALWSGGLFIYVPKNVDVAKPIHVTGSATPDGRALFQRHLVAIGENASLTLVDEYGLGQGDAGRSLRTNAIVELIVGAHAKVNFVTIQNWGREAVSYMTHRAHLDTGARMDTVMTSLGSRISKLDCGAALCGPGAESNIYGLAVCTEDQHFDHHTVHDHQAGSTHSDLHFKIAVRDRANSVYTGLIRIDKGAQFCEAYQENRNLILSPKARVETIPELEIMNNEVRCSHGATIGKINPEEIFYLESRGIGRADAVRLIVTGFIGPIVERIPEYTRKRLHEIMLERLGAK
jgi:Fe-S cluster assembly protein SufD